MFDYFFSRKEWKTVHVFSLLLLLLCPLSTAQGRESKDYRTPRAGEAFETEIFGTKVELEARDRAYFRAINLGGVFTTPSASSPNPLPFFAFFYKRNEPQWYLRSVVAGVFNDIEYSNGSWNDRGFEYILVWENFTSPSPTTEVFGGEDEEETEMYEGHLRPGIGVGFRLPLGPRKKDNWLRVGWLYQPGYSYFAEGEETADNLVIPPDTITHQIKFQIRADAFLRNLLELRHQGWAMGVEMTLAQRQKWRSHDFGASVGREETEKYFTATGFFATAFGLPGVSEKHRILLSVHGGFSPQNLDRFSAMTLGGGPSGDEAASLGRPILYGTALNEFRTTEYLVITAEYRLEVLFFFYLHFRFQGGFFRHRTLEGGSIDFRYTRVGAFSTAINTGFVWDSLLTLEYGFNWEAKHEGDRGRHALVIGWSKSF